MSATHVMVINPNSSTAMTQQIKQVCQNLLPTGQLSFITNTAAPLSIEGYSDGVRAAAALADKVSVIESHDSSRIHAYVVACFDDTGVDALREITSVPVLGIGEAACMAASMLGQKYIVMTTLPRSIAIIEDNLARSGIGKRCAKVYASGIPVLSLETDPDAYAKMVTLCQSAIEETQAEVLVLGCGGMSHWLRSLENDLDITVVDGISVAIKIAAGLANLGLMTSKRISYRTPEIK